MVVQTGSGAGGKEGSTQLRSQAVSHVLMSQLGAGPGTQVIPGAQPGALSHTKGSEKTKQLAAALKAVPSQRSAGCHRQSPTQEAASNPAQPWFTQPQDVDVELLLGSSDDEFAADEATSNDDETWTSDDDAEEDSAEELLTALLLTGAEDKGGALELCWREVPWLEGTLDVAGALLESGAEAGNEVEDSTDAERDSAEVLLRPRDVDARREEPLLRKSDVAPEEAPLLTVREDAPAALPEPEPVPETQAPSTEQW